jgi:hypothetical protein
VVGAAESHPMETFVEAAFDIAETPSSPQSSLGRGMQASSFISAID